MKLKKILLIAILPAVLFACGQKDVVDPVTPPTPGGGGQGGGETPGPAVSMTVCSFNIRYANTADKYPDGSSAAWSARKDAVKKFIDDEKPDLIGLQEVRKEQSQWFSSTFGSEYGYYDVSRDSAGGASVANTASGEGVAVMYRKDRFELVFQDFFWLDADPQRLPGKNDDGTYGEWHSACRRVTVYAQLKDKNNNAIVWFLPTHYDHKSDAARKKSAELMISKMQELTQESNLMVASQVILHVGDLNTTSDKLATLNDNMHYARLEASGKDTYASTFNDFGNSNKIIDHIYYGGKAIKPVKYWVNKKDYGVPFLSDHYPILFQWEYK